MSGAFKVGSLIITTFDEKIDWPNHNSSKVSECDAVVQQVLIKIVELASDTRQQ